MTVCIHNNGSVKNEREKKVNEMLCVYVIEVLHFFLFVHYNFAILYVVYSIYVFTLKDKCEYCHKIMFFYMQILFVFYFFFLHDKNYKYEQM